MEDGIIGVEKYLITGGSSTGSEHIFQMLRKMDYSTIENVVAYALGPSERRSDTVVEFSQEKAVKISKTLKLWEDGVNPHMQLVFLDYGLLDFVTYLFNGKRLPWEKERKYYCAPLFGADYAKVFVLAPNHWGEQLTINPHLNGSSVTGRLIDVYSAAGYSPELIIGHTARDKLAKILEIADPEGRKLRAKKEYTFRESHANAK